MLSRVRSSVLDLAFSCLDVSPEPHGTGPTLLARLLVEERSGGDVGTIALRCQIRIEPQRRRYSSREADRLLDLFGEPRQWAGTMHPMQLATVSHLVPAFRDQVETVVPVPCSYDMEVAAGKYFASLDDGEVPLTVLFSGTVFLAGATGLHTEPIPWHLEAGYRLPVEVWRSMIDRYFPNQGWLRLRRETIDAVRAYAAAQAIVDTDAVVERLLKEAGWPAP
jgi:hypothetical protein